MIIKHIKRKRIIETDTDSTKLKGTYFEPIENIEKGIDSSILSDKKEHIAFL